MKKRASAMLLAGLLLFGGCGQDTQVVAPAAEPVVTEAPTEAAEPTENAEPTKNEEATAIPTPEEEEQVTIQSVFSEHGMKAGTGVTAHDLKNKLMVELIVNNFNSLTCGNEMKPDYVLNQKKSQEEGHVVVEYGKDTLAILDFAKENGMAMRGHTLVWYSQTPEWLFHENFDTKEPLVDREEMLIRMEDMTRGNFEQLKDLGYLDMFYAYDVINEGWMEDGSPRQCHWYEIIGEDYYRYAFYFADKYAPETVDLYYNDYNEQFKADTLVEFVDTLKDEDGRSLIDGIGLQAHLYTTDDLDQYFEAMDKLAETGLKLQLTELDVCLGKYQFPDEKNEDTLKEQGQFYYNLINGIFERVDAGKVQMDALTIWGTTDSASWRREYNPLPFDGAMKPKYAFYGIVQDKDNAGF
jgi:endo-1,4-beta-xylanase